MSKLVSTRIWLAACLVLIETWSFLSTSVSAQVPDVASSRNGLELRLQELEERFQTLPVERTPSGRQFESIVSSKIVADTAADGLADNLARRLQDVEYRLQARDEAERMAAEASAKKFSVRPFGRIQVDWATFHQDESNKATVGEALNGVDIRRARLGVEGEGFDIFFYRFDVDFATFDVVTDTRPSIFDAYLDVQKLPVVGNIRVGHFREPFSKERLESSSDLPFLE